jgi:hypothetical protein
VRGSGTTENYKNLKLFLLNRLYLEIAMGENYAAQKIGRALTSCRISLCCYDACLNDDMPESAAEQGDSFRYNLGSAHRMLAEHFGKLPPSYVQGVESDLRDLTHQFLSLPNPRTPEMNGRSHYRTFVVFALP